MFIECELTDWVRISPEDIPRDAPGTKAWDSKLISFLSRHLITTYLDKVVPGKGLCIRINRITKIDDGLLLPNRDGTVMVKLHFTALMFWPLVGEILEGAVASQDQSGIKVVLGFLPAIKIPFDKLHAGTDFEEDEGHMVWTQHGSKHIWHNNTVVRFRVDLVKDNPGEGDFTISGDAGDFGLGPREWWCPVDTESVAELL